MRHLYSLSGIVVAILLFAAIPAAAQRQYNIWYFGTNAGVDFNNGSPIPLLDGQVVTNEGSAVICDPATGTLLFYTDGRTVWNRSHLPMPNGTGLLGHTSTAQSALIVPLPRSRTRYLIFTIDANENLLENPDRYAGFNYSIVDMTAAAGLGDVVSKNTRLSPHHVAEKLCGIRRCEDSTYWVIVHEARGSAFHAHHITAGGITNTVVSRAGRQYDLRDGSNIGCLTATRDGSRLAAGVCCQEPDTRLWELELFDFDPAVGIVSRLLRPLTIFSRSRLVYGVAFSPDGTKLYAHEELDSTPSYSVFRTVQYDLESGAPTTLLSTQIPRNLHHTPMPRGTIQLAPNGKLYVAVHNMKSLDEIADPNAPGVRCHYTRNKVALERYCTFGLPNSIHNDAVPPPILVTKSPAGICVGDSVSLVASGASTYRWYPTDGLSCTDCSEPFASPSRTTKYHVEMVTDVPCSGIDTRIDSVVVVVEPASVNVTGGGEICIGDTLMLRADGGVDYRWSPTEGLSCTDCPDPLAFPTKTTNYYVSATNTNGCVSTEVVWVGVFPIPNIDAGHDTSICIGESTRLTASGSAAVTWSPAIGLSCTECLDPVTAPTTTTTYFARAISAGGCGFTAVDSVTVLVRPPLPVDAGNDIVICRGESARLHATGAGRYRWTSADRLSCIDCPDPEVAPATTTTYHVTGITANGCPAIDSVTVNVITRPITFTIGRDHHTAPGGAVTVPITVDDPQALDGIGIIVIGFGYRPPMILPRGINTAGTMLDGWRRETIADSAGEILIRFSSAGRPIASTNMLARIELAAFLGDSIASEIPLHIEIPGNECLTVSTQPGRLRLDSVCGLSMRLIELNDELFLLKQNVPNPFNPVTEITFSIGLDGPALLRVFDIRGNEIARPIDGSLSAGEYTVTFDAGDLPSGMYIYKLESSGVTRTRWMTVVK